MCCVWCGVVVVVVVAVVVVVVVVVVAVSMFICLFCCFYFCFVGFVCESLWVLLLLLVGWFSIFICLLFLFVCCCCLGVGVGGVGGGGDILQICQSVCAPFSFDCDDAKGGFTLPKSPPSPVSRQVTAKQ